MPSRSLVSLLVAGGVIFASSQASADVVVNVPGVNVQVGRPGVMVQAPGVNVRVGPPVLIAPPPVVPVVPVAPVPVVPAPTLATPVRAMTLGEFATSFRPVGGVQVVTVEHPFTGAPVQLSLNLPPGSPRRIRVNRRVLVLDYGRQIVSVHFYRNGATQVVY